MRPRLPSRKRRKGRDPNADGAPFGADGAFPRFAREVQCASAPIGFAAGVIATDSPQPQAEV